jgi:AcrR family transcriptional regulator
MPLTSPAKSMTSDGDAYAANIPASQRILAEARQLFYRHGYSAFTMDDLAAALGMSKKTLYVHFPGKDAMIRAIIDGFAAEVRADTEALLANPSLRFAEKLRGFAQGMVERLSRLSPAILADVEAYAPELHRHILTTRARTLPYVFGRILEEGQLSGAVRDDVSPVFASEFFLHAMQTLMQADALRRLRLTPETCFDHAIRLFFAGLLTPSGQKEHEKLVPR